MNFYFIYLINLISFGYGNGKPKILNDDILVSVRDMKNVIKSIRDKYMGTSDDLQIELMHIKSNKEYYDSLLQKLINIIKLSYQENINIYIGCE